MSSKYINTILTIIFLFLAGVSVQSQQKEVELFHPHLEYENYEINEKFLQSFESPEAFYMQSSIADFRVNEQVGNSYKSNIKSAINNNGVSIVVWHDLREGTANVYAQLADSNGNLIGANIKVNSSEILQTFEQPDVAVNEDGQFLIIWRSTDSGVGIDGQLIDDDGSFVNENFELSDETLNSGRYYPSISSNGKEFIAVWSDRRNGGLYDIYAQRLNKDGSKIGENFIVHTDSQTTSKIYPDIALSKSGSFAVAWYSNVDGGNKIFSSVLDNNNEFRSEQILISEISNSSSNNFSPTIASSMDGFAIAWSRYLDNDYNIICQLLDTAGAKIDSNFVINDDMKSTQLYASAASNNKGNVVVTWYDYRNSFPQIYSQKIVNTQLNGNNFTVSEEELKSTKTNVSCSINDKGKIVVSWLNYTDLTEYQVFSRILDSSKSPISETFRVDNDENSSAQSSPELITFDDSSYIIVWTDNRNRTSNIFFQIYNSDGTLLGENKIAGSTSYKLYPKIIQLKNNNFTIFWREYYRGTFNQYEIVGQKYFSNGEIIGDEFLVSSDEIGGAVGQLDAASNSSGEFAVTWERRIGNINRIYAKKYDANGNQLGNILQVSNDTVSYKYAPKIGIDSAGNFAVTYYLRKNDYEILLHRYNFLAEQIDSAIIVNDDDSNFNQYVPDISVNSNGDAVVSWFDYRSPIGIYFQKYSNIGSETSFEKVDSNIAAADYNVQYTLPNVSLNNNGEFAIAWSEKSSSQDDSKFRLFNSAQTPVTEVLYVSEVQERNQKNPFIHFTEDNIYNVWVDNRKPSVGYDIWANIYDYQDLITDIENNQINIPKEFVLHQNYPNPFNPTTTIKYTIPVVDANFASTTMNIKLIVYDILGREIATLVNEYQKPGSYEVNFDASHLSSGIYFYKLQTGKFTQVNKMMLLK
jgi:hypothetical protein